MKSERKFSDDHPFTQIVDNACLEDPGVKALYEWLCQASGTRASFMRFCKMLDAVKAPWKAALKTFVEDMKAGTYRREFGKMYNRRGGPARTSFECSQTSELFSLTRQAIGYNCR